MVGATDVERKHMSKATLVKILFPLAIVLLTVAVAIKAYGPSKIQQFYQTITGSKTDKAYSYDLLNLSHSSPKPLAQPLPPKDTAVNLDAWNESATWKQFNSKLELNWANKGGDWIDSKGVEQGTDPFASIRLKDDDLPGTVELDITDLILESGKAEIVLKRTGGANFRFHSRQSKTGRPQLRLGDGSLVYPSADVSLNKTTFKSSGKDKTLNTTGTIYIRFDLPLGRLPGRAVLVLTSTGVEYGDQTLSVFLPNSKIRTLSRPSWVKPDGRVVMEISAKDVKRTGPDVKLRKGVAISSLEHPGLTWLNANVVIPNMTAGCATVYQKLGNDFRPGQGGKLPGFSNTGDAIKGKDIVDGVSLSDSGWGGRSPDGVHWSARTGYGHWDENQVSAHTYFYAMGPHNSYGWVDSIGYPFPKGEWLAYVQCMKLNTVTADKGNSDGALYYEVAGFGPVYSREDIRWRDKDVPQAEMREFWINYYCGGASCGSISNRGTVYFHKAVITPGLPDMSAVKAIVDQLNIEDSK